MHLDMLQAFKMQLTIANIASGPPLPDHTSLFTRGHCQKSNASNLSSEGWHEPLMPLLWPMCFSSKSSQFAGLAAYDGITLPPLLALLSSLTTQNILAQDSLRVRFLRLYG